MRQEETVLLYTQEDCLENEKRLKREWGRLALCVLPILAASIAGFVLRVQLLAIGGAAAVCGVLIFLIDLKILPLVRYGRFLKEVLSGLRHEMAGTLVRIGEEEVYEDSVYFREIIVNIYEDLAEEGERRFLMGFEKPVPAELLGKDVKVTHHGSYLLAVEPLKGAENP